MNYYERVQASIDYIEEKLMDSFSIEEAAIRAMMSGSNFYRMFYAMTGYSVKDYCLRRRMVLACNLLRESDIRIIDLAFTVDFQSQAAFSRAFKRIVGVSPNRYRCGEGNYAFERMDLMDKYFDIQDPDLLEQYPDIKVLKELDKRTVVYYCAVSESPEEDALKVIMPWAEEKGLLKEGRIFGYNNPSPSEGNPVYGYEFQITVADDYLPDHPDIGLKEMPGGLYAVMTTRISEIEKAWMRFSKWLELSPYEFGSHQWMEEHFSFEGDFKLDLYLPIKK